MAIGSRYTVVVMIVGGGLVGFIALVDEHACSQLSV